MIVIAKSHKENLILGGTMFGILIFMCIICGGLIFRPSPIYVVVSSFFWLFSLFMIIFSIYLIYTQTHTKDNIIEYDEYSCVIVIHCIKSDYSINKQKIKNIKLYNKGFQSLGPLIFLSQQSYGKIAFELDNGKKIITPLIDDVLNVYDKLNSLI